MKSLIAGALALAAVFLACDCQRTLGSEWDQVYLNISPYPPTIATPVSITAWTWFGDPGQKFVSANYSLGTNRIDMNVVMQDLHAPGTGWITVMTKGGGSVNCGLLPQGHYDVYANIWKIPWGSSVPLPFRSGSASFDVLLDASTSVWKGGSAANPSSWDLSQNWFPATAAPNGAGLTALFGDQVPEANVVNIGTASRTVGNLRFTSANSTTIQNSGSSRLFLDNGGRDSLIEVAGNHTIKPLLYLNNNAVLDGPGTLTLSGGVTGNRGVTVLGNLTASRIQVNSLAIGTAAAAVPEPSTFTLFNLGVVGSLAFAWRKRTGGFSFRR
jgi:hypothetical protein